MKRFSFLLVWLLLGATLFAETRWLGNAQDVPQIDTFTVAGTWAAADTETITCNSKAITLTCGASMDTTAEVAAGIAEMINETGHDPDDLDADMTINAGGYEYGEFRDVVATVSGSVVTVTSVIPGTPFTLTESETTAGDGAVTQATAQAATGKHWWSDAGNWEGGDIPDADESANFDQGSVDVKYGLDTPVDDVSLYKRNGYTGNIGLAATNNTHTGFPYKEYRLQRLVLPITATTGLQTHVVGERNSSLPATGFVYLDFESNDGSLQELIVFDAPAHGATGASVKFYGGNDLDLYVHKGSVAYGDGLSTQATGIGILHVNFLNNVAGDARVFVGIFGSMETGGPITQTGGTLLMEGSASSTSTIDINAGKFVFPGTCGTLNVRGGTVSYNNDSTATTTNLYVFGGGTLDASKTETVTITNATVYKGAAWIDPFARLTLTNGMDFIGCDWSDITSNTKESQTWTPSAL